MSDALMGCQPRTEEPSKPMPSSKSASSSRETGRVVCCHVPGRSQNLRSTNCTSCFFASSITSLGFTLPPSGPNRPPTFVYSTTGTSPVGSDRVLAALTGADADGVFDGRDEDLPVADLAGTSRLLDRVDRALHERVWHHDVDLHLR